MRLKITLFLFINLLYFGHVEAQSCSGADFEERNGLAVVQLDTKTSGGWVRRSESGSSGGQALLYNGSNSFNSAPGNSVLTYKVKVNSPGTYRVIIRNKIGIISSGPEPATSEHNDLWLRINGSEFFGQSGSSKLWPKGSGRTPNPAGASGNGYLKVYTNKLGWNWTSFTNDGPGHKIYVKFNNAGVYEVKIGGRSNGYFVDKLALYKEGSVSASAAQGAAATDCDGSTPPPPPPPPPGDNEDPSVRFTNLSNGQSFANGSDITVGVSSSDSDGSVVKHQIFVNGSLVDTDGSTYTAHQILEASAGSYEIKATVTDNSGATASTTVNITVGSGTPPPPPPPPSDDNNAPSVSFTSLTNNTQVPAGTTVSVGLSSSDSDGSVVKHEIFVNGTLVDTDGSFYTSHQIVNPSAGNYAIKATVTDNDGATTSATVNITIGSGTPPPPPPPSGNAAPSVSFTSLSNGQQVAVGSTVSVGLSASDSDGSVVKHQIFVNGTLVDTDGTFYTAHPITNIKAGSYAIKATVTDNDGATSSATVNITAGSGTPPPPPPSGDNVAPTVRFTSLSNGQRVATGSRVLVSLSAKDSDGTIVKHQIFVNGTLVDTDGTFYSSHPIVNISAGSYAIKATVTDNDGASTSATVNITAGSVSNSTSAKAAFAYPNPVKSDGKVSLKLTSGGSGDYLYIISNSLGVTLESGKFSADKSKTDVELQLSNVGNQGEGVYYMTLISKESKQVIPIIRQ